MDSFHLAVYQNLRLLTQVYPNLDMESKLQKGMFKKPNTKGMQSVFYSLLSILDPDYCRTHVPWPVSFASDSYKFRTAIINFIEKECIDFEPPKLLPSLLNRADGEKYVRFVFNFVTYVTRTVLNRKFNVTVLLKPSVGISYDESINVLNNASAHVIGEDKETKNQHEALMRNGCYLLNEADNELQSKLQEFVTKKEELATEVKDSLSYTNITEETFMEGFLTDLENELTELQRNQNMLELNACSILNKKKRLLQLISLKQTMHQNLIDIDFMKSLLTENFAEVVKIPLPMIQSSLFVHSDLNTRICLKTFLHLGYRLVHSLIQRFIKLNPSNTQLTVFETVSDILRNTSKKFDDLSSLDIKFSSLIKDCQQVIPHLESLYHEEVGINADYVEVFLTLKSLENTCSRLSFNPKLEKPLWIEACLGEGLKPNEDPVEKIKKQMQGMSRKK